MMKRFTDLLRPNSITNPSEQSRLRLTIFFTAFFAVLNLILALLVAARPAPMQIETVVILMGSFALNVTAFLFAQTGRWRVSAALFVVYTVGASLVTAAVGPEASFFLILVIPIIYIGLVFGVRGIGVVFLLTGAPLFLFGALRAQQGPIMAIPEAFNDPLAGVLVTVALLFASALMMSAIVLEQQRLQGFSNRLYAQLRATAEVAQTTSAIVSLDQLLPKTVDYIRDRFGFYHVQIFLVDAERRYADLVASTGDAGQMLIQRGHRLAVGSQSIIGRVTASGEPVMAADTATDPLQRGTELLPETRSELALPLIAGDKLIGALDVQSTRPNAFSQEDADTLQIMATQVAIAVRNAQLFEDQRRALNENRRLFLEAETSLREIERLNQRLIGGAWTEYMTDRARSTVSYTLRDNAVVEEATWTPALQQAFEKRRPVIFSENSRHIAAVPIELRGQALGAIEVEITEKLRQSDMLDMLQAIASRLALNLDNARLFEEAQKSAQQELEINTISTRIQSTGGMDGVLRTVLTELARALHAEGASVRLGIPADQPGAGPTLLPTLNGASGAHSDRGDAPSLNGMNGKDQP